MSVNLPSRRSFAWPSDWLAPRLPFFYGWVVIAVAFVTMAIGVNSRTAFSLLFPPILEEFGWDRAVTAAAFSIGFVASVAIAPFTGLLMDRVGPRVVVSLGAVSVSIGLVLTTRMTSPAELYLTLGALVVGGSVFMSYIGHSAFLPRWFQRRRGLAVGIAFSGVGVGSIILFPLAQDMISSAGWRETCVWLAGLILVTIIPLNFLLQRTQPQDMGLEPDGDGAPDDIPAADVVDNVVDEEWVNTEWTIRTALRTARYWWLFSALITALYAWYAVQVHQTRYLIEVGFTASDAAWALGLVGLMGIVGQIGLGHLSDRVGREVGWTFACVGFASCYGVLIAMEGLPHPAFVYAVAATQGLLGYGVAPIYSAIAAEIFQGKNFGAIFGTLSVATTLGAASGPWVTGLLYDRTESYTLSFAIAAGLCLFSCAAVWIAAPRKVRLVAGRAQARHQQRAKDAGNASLAPSGLIPNATAAAAPGPADVSGRNVHARVAHIVIRSTPITLTTRGRVSLQAVALDSSGQAVAEVSFTWQLSNDLLEAGCELQLTDSSADDSVTLVAGPNARMGTVSVSTRHGPILTRRDVTITA